MLLGQGLAAAAAEFKTNFLEEEVVVEEVLEMREAQEEREAQGVQAQQELLKPSIAYL